MLEELQHWLTDPHYVEEYIFLSRALRWLIFAALGVGLLTIMLKRPRTAVQHAAAALVTGFFLIMTQLVFFYLTGINLNETLIGVLIGLIAAIGCIFFTAVCLWELGVLARDGYRLWRKRRRDG